jgi:nicotinamidase/pyrazinamidase
MNALVIVDVQNDFCPGGALAVPEGDRVVGAINRVQPHFDLAVATQDWHPADHGSFAANHQGKQPGDVVELGGLEQTLWPVHCVQHTPGAAFHPELDQSRIAQVFQKGTDPAIDSYSGFFDNGRRKSTGLDDYLKERTVTEVYIAGLATDYCVKSTALDAVRLGFPTHLLADATRGVNLHPADVDRAVEAMRAAGVVVVSCEEVIGRL